jgi:pyridoxamine 5'-phosphate oxidase
MEEINKHIRTVRKDYWGDTLDVKTVATNPLEQFERWMGEVLSQDVPDANAMTIATVSKNGQPSARIVLLKDFSEKGFVFFTNYNSQKGQEIEHNPKAALLFFWPKLMRQVKIEGVLEKISPVESENYFKTRPEGNKISAWVSQQSAEIDSKEELELNFKQLEKKYKGQDIPYPEYWGGFCLRPKVYEFWQGQANRLHDRIRYELECEECKWKIKRLAP